MTGIMNGAEVVPSGEAHVTTGVVIIAASEEPGEAHVTTSVVGIATMELLCLELLGIAPVYVGTVPSGGNSASGSLVVCSVVCGGIVGVCGVVLGRVRGAHVGANVVVAPPGGRVPDCFI